MLVQHSNEHQGDRGLLPSGSESNWLVEFRCLDEMTLTRPPGTRPTGPAPTHASAFNSWLKLARRKFGAEKLKRLPVKMMVVGTSSRLGDGGVAGKLL